MWIYIVQSEHTIAGNQHYAKRIPFNELMSIIAVECVCVFVCGTGVVALQKAKQMGWRMVGCMLLHSGEHTFKGE